MTTSLPCLNNSDTEADPPHHPRTVVPEYACAVSAKFEVIRRAIQENFASTKYFSWIDIGHFKEYSESSPDFRLGLPPDFNPSQIAMLSIVRRKPTLSPIDIVKNNLVWVGTGIILGHRQKLIIFCKLYQLLMEAFLAQAIFNSEKQILYGAANADQRIFQMIQTYDTNNEKNLGNLMLISGTLQSPSVSAAAKPAWGNGEVNRLVAQFYCKPMKDTMEVEITVVSAYFDIATFVEGTYLRRSPAQSSTWLEKHSCRIVQATQVHSPHSQNQNSPDRP
eukprot:Filipodium_phascolosomae@DN2389_c0_g1_i3.p1